MRTGMLCGAVILSSLLQTSCIFTGLVASGIAATSDPRTELVERRGEFGGHYLGIEAVDGIEYFAFAVKGVLEGRDESEVFTLYIPDAEDQGRQDLGPFSKSVQPALARQTQREHLEDRPSVAVRFSAGSGSTGEEPKKKGERPSRLQMYVREDVYGMTLYYDLRGKRYYRPIKMGLPYVERSSFLTGIQKPLLFITIPVDIAISPVVIPLALLLSLF